VAARAGAADARLDSPSEAAAAAVPPTNPRRVNVRFASDDPRCAVMVHALSTSRAMRMAERNDETRLKSAILQIQVIRF
jgi:hypothetical protein